MVTWSFARLPDYIVEKAIKNIHNNLMRQLLPEKQNLIMFNKN